MNQDIQHAIKLRGLDEKDVKNESEERDSTGKVVQKAASALKRKISATKKIELIKVPKLKNNKPKPQVIPQ